MHFPDLLKSICTLIELTAQCFPTPSRSHLEQDVTHNLKITTGEFQTLLDSGGLQAAGPVQLS